MPEAIHFREPRYSIHPEPIPTATAQSIPHRIGPWVIRRTNSEGDARWLNPRERKPSLSRLVRQVDEDCAMIEKLTMSTMFAHNTRHGDGRRQTYPCEKTSAGGYCQICGFIGSQCAPVREETEEQMAGRSLMTLKGALVFSAFLNIVFVIIWTSALFSS